MRIAHINFSFTVGGIDTMLVDILNHQVIKNEVFLVIINDKFDNTLLSSINPKVKFYCLKRKEGSFNPWSLIRLNLLIQKLKPDVIHCHNSNVAKFLMTNIPKVLTVHAMNYPVKEYDKYSKICAISSAVKNDISSRINLNNLEVVYNGVLTSQFNANIEKYESFKIVVISRLDHKTKGLDLFLEAIKSIVDEKSIEELTVDIIGDGSSKHYLQKFIMDNKLDDYVNLTGNKSRDYIYKNLAKYSMLVQPSRNEGFGLTIVEAMCARIPVLASNIDGPKEILDNGKFGYLFESNSIESLKTNIIHIYSLLHSGSQSVRANVDAGYDRAVAFFDIKNTATKYLKVYSDIISKHI